MGNFYTNITVLGRSSAMVTAQLGRLARDAFVADLSEMCVVYDRECDEQNSEILASLAAHLSTHLEAKSFAILNHDDDILWLQLDARTELIAQYANCGGPRTNVKALCHVLGKPNEVFQVWLLLKRPFVFQASRHRRLARRLGLPKASVGAGFKYVSRGESPADVNPGELVRVRRDG